MDLMRNVKIRMFNKVGSKDMVRVITIFMMEDIFAQINKVNKLIDTIIQLIINY